ncbi:hypothetical protein C0992_009939, partial [Termitomyces sp. T32_za158]
MSLHSDEDGYASSPDAGHDRAPLFPGSFARSSTEPTLWLSHGVALTGMQASWAVSWGTRGSAAARPLM